MKRTQSSVVSIVLVVWVVASGAGWSDWPRFGGPHGNGVADAKGLMKRWPAGGPRVLWTVPLGAGYGGPIVADGKVYVLDRVVAKQDVLRCWDLNTGKELWKFAVDAPGKISHPGSRSHPTVGDRYIFFVGTYGELYCISKASHRPVWHKNIRDLYGGRQPHWAFSQSPALYKDAVIVTPIGTKAGVVALQRSTGKELWRSQPLQGGIGYTSPVITRIGGVDQVLAVTTTQTVGVDLRNGKVLWSYRDWKCQIPIASPFPVGDGRIFLTGGYGAGAALFKVQKTGSEFTCTTLFRTKECNGQIHQPLLYKGYLYLNGNDKKKRNGLMCLDLNGKVRWQTGTRPGFDWGGLLLADGMIYVVDANTGELCLVKPDPSRYIEVGRVKLLGGPEIWGTIALSDGKLLRRDQRQMKCVDVKGR